MIIAHTVKGKGVRGAENYFSGYHTLKVTDRSALDEAISGLNTKLLPELEVDICKNAVKLISLPEKHAGRPVLSSDAYKIEYSGADVMNIQDARDLYLAKVGNSMTKTTAPLYMISPDFVRTDTQKKQSFDEFSHFYNIGIREQHAIAMAHGIATTQPEAKILVHMWDFCSIRAIDQMNAAAQAGSNIVVNGADAGIFHGNNGRTHISLGQPGAFMSFPEIEMFEPADAQDLFNVYSHSFTSHDGFKYVRLHSGEMSHLERNNEDKDNVNAYKTFQPDKPAQLAIFSSGAFVKNAIEAAKLMELEYGVPAEVVNVVNQKRIGQEALKLFHDRLPILTLYNGNPIILQSSVSRAVMESRDIEKPSIIIGHGITKGTSGLLHELTAYYKLDAEGIALTAMKEIFNR
jgi:transketolase C-terminal domain/subunit